MMASMPMGPSFSPHPGGMQQHPGAPPGHHMAPGMAHNPSQPGATPAMAHQMVAHLGVSGPGPQISAGALMGGMPPGTPNAHAAMQHLNPQQMVAYQQQMNGMGFPNNQAMQQQLQQVRLQQLQQAQHQRIMQAQQAQYNNMGGMPIGVPGMAQMNPQQMAQLMQRRAMGAPMPMHHMQQHLAQQHPGQGMNPNLIAQQLALQQQQQQQQQLQQQQQQQMAQQGNNPGQHPINPQGPGGMNMQAQLAALHTQQAHAQQSAAAVQAAQAQAQAQQGGPGQPQQPQQQPQAQPPQQPPQQQPGQPQQPNQQQPQVQPGSGVNGPAQNQGPAPGPTPQPNAQQQVSPQTPQTTQAQQAQLAHAQQVQAAANVASLMQQQKRENSANLKGQCLLKLNLFNEHLNGFTGSQGADGLKYWHHFVQRFFSQKGVFRQTFKKREDDGSDSKPYEIDYAALPRFFNVHFESGVSKMQLVMQGTTDKALPHDGHFIEIAKASVFYWYDSGSHVVHNGTLRIQFDSEQNIELFDFVVENHEEYHSRRAIIEAARPSHTWIKEWRSLNPPDSKQSPEMSKKGKQRPFKSPMTPPPDIELPPSCVKIGVGIPEGVFQFLEMADIIGQMSPLFIYSHSHPGISPYAALEQFMTQVSGQGPNVNGQPMPQGVPRTPGYNQFPMGASPAMANQMLPGSPHMGSPAPGQMQAPAMQLQVSQQGTNSSGPSANTSPQQQNKKRRASQAKLEDDGPTSAPTPATIGTPQMPQMNGVQGKAKHPPTPRMQKRMKNN